jgi:hypothetical protein
MFIDDLGILLLSTIVFSQIQADRSGNRSISETGMKTRPTRTISPNTMITPRSALNIQEETQRSYEEGFEEATMNLSIFEKIK